MGIGWPWWPKRRGDRENEEPDLPAGVSLQPRLPLTQAKLSLYNMIALAVRDHYLVLAQVPIWSLVDVRAPDPAVRRLLLKKLAFRQVDFVLVHPGTLAVAKVIEVEDSSPSSPRKQERDRLIEAVVRTAGLELIRLKAQETYTVPALAALLGMEPTE